MYIEIAAGLVKSYPRKIIYNLNADYHLKPHYAEFCYRMSWNERKAVLTMLLESPNIVGMFHNRQCTFLNVHLNTQYFYVEYLVKICVCVFHANVKRRLFS